jgi:hypothetical protein
MLSLKGEAGGAAWSAPCPNGAPASDFKQQDATEDLDYDRLKNASTPAGSPSWGGW